MHLNTHGFIIVSQLASSDTVTHTCPVEPGVDAAGIVNKREVHIRTHTHTIQLFGCTAGVQEKKKTNREENISLIRPILLDSTPAANLQHHSKLKAALLALAAFNIFIKAT